MPDFEVVTYNAHLLPLIANSIAGKRSNADYRCKKIAERLSKFDLVGISEVFDKRLSANLIDEMNADSNRTFSFVRSPPPKRVFQFASGGLILFSRFPILENNSLVFADGSRFLRTWFKAADGLAAKGALHAKLKINATQELDCFLVHLESFSKPIRIRQIEELAAFVKTHCQAGAPYLLMGDFNVIGPRSPNKPCSDSPRNDEYRDLVSQLTMTGFELVDIAIEAGGESPANGTSDALANDGGDRIDYLLLGTPNSNSTLWSASSKTLQLIDNGVKEGSLSDHAAVWARIKFEATLEGD